MTTILITGANRGLGLEFVKQYASEGGSVIACCREPGQAKDLNAVAEKSGGKVRVLPLDVAGEKSIAALAQTLGAEPIDVLIANAGVMGPKQQNAEHIDAAGWLETFRVNAIAPMLVAQALHGNLKAGKDRKLVAITSQLGSTTNNGGGSYAYRSSKAALNNAMRGLSRDWSKDGILVGIFHPGWVRTDMGGKNAPVAPQESVRGLRLQIARLNEDNSGSFRDFTGTELPW